MNIHYYKQFFSGPSAPGSQQPRKLVETLAARGHSVDVICTDFNVYNEQDEPAEMFEVGDAGSVRVHRLPSARGLRKGLMARLRTYLGFTWPATRTGLSLPRPDVVIGSIQPLFTGWIAKQVARFRRAPFVLEVRDLWPDALEVKGAVTGWKAALLHRMANGLYRGADRLVSLTPGIKAELVSKGINPDQIDVFPNGFDPELFQVGADAVEEIRHKYGWNGSFVVLYTGTHTEVTAIDVIVQAADVLRDHDEIRFELFGQGQSKPQAQDLARKLDLTNIRFHDPVPKSEIPGLVASCDVAIMTLFRSPLIHIYFENKFVDYMGSGKPIVAAMDGHQAEIIQRWETGRVVPSFDHEGLAEIIRTAVQDYEPFRKMGESGKRLVLDRLLLPDILDRYADLVEAVGAGQNPGAAWEPEL